MTDDLLKAIREAVREEEGERRPELDALVEGRLSEADRAKLEESARQDPGLARAVEWNRPLEGDARDRMHARVMAQLAGEAASTQRGDAPAEVVALPAPRRPAASRSRWRWA